MSGWSNVCIKCTSEFQGQKWVLDLPGGSQTPGQTIVLYEFDGGNNQHWDVVDSGDHSQGFRFYYIINRASGQALTVTATQGAGLGSRVFQEGLGHWDTQKWRVNDNGNGLIWNKYVGLVLDAKGSSFQNGTPIIMWGQNGGLTDNQNWRLGNIIN